VSALLIDASRESQSWKAQPLTARLGCVYSHLPRFDSPQHNRSFCLLPIPLSPTSNKWSVLHHNELM
jgi:hypothetical protein